MAMTLADLLRSGKTPEEINALLSQSTITSGSLNPNFMAGEPYAPPQEQQVNSVVNSRTGRAVPLLDAYGRPSQSQGQSQALDYSSAPVEFGGMKGYRVKGDPMTVIMGDGRIVRMGADTGADRKRMAEDLQMQMTRQKLSEGNVDEQLKRAQLAELTNPKKVAGFTSMKDIFDAENKLADDHKSQSKDFISVRDAYSRLDSAMSKATSSAPAALAGATTFMKLLDPGSVVRESELGMALAATGVIDRMQNYFNTLKNGKVLTESQANEFREVGKKLYEAAAENQRTLDTHYTGRAKTYGLDPAKVIGDYYIKTPAAPQGATPQTAREKTQAIFEAHKAIAKGADKAAVKQRLNSMGITDHGIK